LNASAAPSNLVIIGASGRMGTSLLQQLPRFAALRLHGAVVSPGSDLLGRDSGECAGTAPTGVPLTARLEAALAGAAVALDFSTAGSAAERIQRCGAAGVPLLLGTTGLGSGVTEALTEAARRIPVLVAANTSFGAAVLTDLVRQATRALGASFEVSVRDVHHRGKRDAPSGTALALGTAVQEASGTPNQIQYTSVRDGDVVGQHEVLFLGEGESLRLVHEATDRSIFARGALRAALWLVRQPPGRYQISDLFKEK
jgi:4-hydroxy-tetrahydrodipicolinate reductase